VFQEVRRVLRKDGNVWMNYGEAYASTPNGRIAAATKEVGNDDRTFRDKPISTVGPILVQRAGDDTRGAGGKEGYRPGHSSRVAAGGTLKPKDRMLLPARVAIALQDDGWWIRDEIIWHKPNPMPSSVKDRTTPAHEMIYMLSKAPRYYYDQEAVLEPCSPNTHARLAQNVIEQIGSARANGGSRADRPMKAVGRSNTQQQIADNSNPSTARTMGGCNDRYFNSPKTVEAGLGIKNNQSFANAVALPVLKRNPRSVWTVTPKGFKEAHFATFPPALIEPCIKAGCPEGGTVLDPFFGAGTTGLVCQQLNRNCIGIELNPEYVEIARRRLGLDVLSETESMLA
jgi:DNA modification methylase